MSLQANAEEISPIERMTMEADIVCAGFGPAVGGFLTALTREWSANPEDPAFASKAVPGMPLQVLCYERADDISAGVSGIVTAANGIRASFPGLNVADIPMAATVGQERVLYLLDPIGASRRSHTLRFADAALRGLGKLARLEDDAFELPWTPAFLHKHGGLVLSMGQFNQWVGAQLMAGGLVQIWPGTPISAPIFEGNSVQGVAPDGPGRRPSRQSRRRLLSRHGCARAANRRGRWPRRRSRAGNRPALRTPRRPLAIRVGSGNEDGHRAARRFDPSAGYRLAHIWFS